MLFAVPRRTLLRVAVLLAVFAIVGVGHTFFGSRRLIGSWRDVENPQWARYFGEDGTLQDIGYAGGPSDGHWTEKNGVVSLHMEGAEAVHARWEMSGDGHTLALTFSDEELGEVTQTMTRLGRRPLRPKKAKPREEKPPAEPAASPAKQ